MARSGSGPSLNDKQIHSSRGQLHESLPCTEAIRALSIAASCFPQDVVLDNGAVEELQVREPQRCPGLYLEDHSQPSPQLCPQVPQLYTNTYMIQICIFIIICARPCPETFKPGVQPHLQCAHTCSAHTPAELTVCIKGTGTGCYEHRTSPSCPPSPRPTHTGMTHARERRLLGGPSLPAAAAEHREIALSLRLYWKAVTWARDEF